MTGIMDILIFKGNTWGDDKDDDGDDDGEGGGGRNTPVSGEEQEVGGVLMGWKLVIS